MTGYRGRGRQLLMWEALCGGKWAQYFLSTAVQLRLKFLRTAVAEWLSLPFLCRLAGADLPSFFGCGRG